MQDRIEEIQKLNAETRKMMSEHDWHRIQIKFEPWKIVVYSVAATLAALGVFVSVARFIGST